MTTNPRTLDSWSLSSDFVRSSDRKTMWVCSTQKSPTDVSVTLRNVKIPSMTVITATRANQRATVRSSDFLTSTRPEAVLEPSIDRGAPIDPDRPVGASSSRRDCPGIRPAIGVSLGRQGSGRELVSRFSKESLASRFWLAPIAIGDAPCR